MTTFSRTRPSAIAGSPLLLVIGLGIVSLVAAPPVARAENPGAPGARTIISVHRGGVEARTSVDAKQLAAGESATISGGRIHEARTRLEAPRPRQTWLAVLEGTVLATPRAPARTSPFPVPAGYEAVFGEGEPRLGRLDPSRVLLARLLGQRTGAVDPGTSLSASVRAALTRLNALAAERLRLRDGAGLRGLAVADCRIGARSLVTLTEALDELGTLTRTVDVAYRVSDWRASGPDRALARYAAAISLSPHVAPALRAEIAVAGTVSYRRLSGTWRFENFSISHASVDTRKLPVAFDRINDLLVPAHE